VAPRRRRARPPPARTLGAPARPAALARLLGLGLALRRLGRRRVVVAPARADDREQHEQGDDRGGDDPCPRHARRARGLAARVEVRADRELVEVGRPLVGALVLLDEQRDVEPQVLAVGAQEALDVGGAGKDVPLLVLERTQVLRADLGRRLDLVDVDLGAHARLTEGGPDLGHWRP
jgi:hypothetical protein